MSRREPSDIGASVRQRLLNLSRETGDDFQLVLNRYALERFLFRLGHSPHRDRFVLKGAMLFSLWGGSIYRPTRDLDLHGSGESSVAEVVRSIRDVASLESAEDGLVFDIGSIAGEEIREDQEYDGVRVTLEARLSGARAHLQIDVGFGDAVIPGATDGEYPTLLGMPAPWIRVYPRETVIAEKFHAIVVLGIANSRMKDFYDLRTLSMAFPFDGIILSGAIKGTFDRRRTALPSGVPVGLSDEFAVDRGKRTQWEAFLRRSRIESGGSVSFQQVVVALRGFLLPIAESLVAGRSFESKWSPPGLWF